MVNGKRSMDKMTWDEFQAWQRWDEFPERADNPPMTVDVMFFYEGHEYYIVLDYGRFHIYTEDWNEIYSHENFLKLLTTPVKLFHDKSFSESIVCIGFDT